MYEASLVYEICDGDICTSFCVLKILYHSSQYCIMPLTQAVYENTVMLKGRPVSPAREIGAIFQCQLSRVNYKAIT